MRKILLLLTLLIGLYSTQALAAAMPTCNTTGQGLQWDGSNGFVCLTSSSSSQGVIAYLKTANMNTTADQLFTMVGPPTKYAISNIWTTNCNSSPAGALGGVYTASSKGGTAVVAATQAYIGLTGTTVILPLTLVANMTTTTFTAAQLYFALTTGLGSAATCDIYIQGVGLP